MYGKLLGRIGLVAVLWAGSILPGRATASEPRPNILWITCEDISPNLGCYGDSYAVTPHLDRLAEQGVRFTHAFAPIGVCAPSRSSLILGMYAPSVGSHPMRSAARLPDSIRCFPEYLRHSGYYCTNNVKTDYNFRHPPATWDESSAKAHWRNRKAGQPFFAVFNFTSCHESQIRLPEKAYQERTAGFSDRERHDPARAVLPPYHPDTPEVRRDWAHYADMITFMDKQSGAVLRQLEEDGLAEDTIIFFFSDHGAGMPRSKRWLYDSSVRVPFITRFPKKHQHLAPGKPGTTADRLVSFVDFGPTVLSLAGVKVPAHMQGVPFLGDQSGEPREYVFGFRDRMDERHDMLRSVRDRRYKYIRNYLPHLPWFHHQHVSYMYEMPTMRVWQRLADEGQLRGPSALFMAQSKPPEELYDTEADPHEIHNLAQSPAHRHVLDRLRLAHRQWVLEIVDLGFLPEADLRTRFSGVPEYEAARRKPALYPLEAILSAADLASRCDASTAAQLRDMLTHNDPAVRYWAATGLGSLAQDADVPLLKRRLEDESASVRIAAADALCRLGQHEPAVPLLIKELEGENEWVRLSAVQALDRIGAKGRPAIGLLRKRLDDSNEYVVRVAKHALAGLSEPAP